MKKSQQNPNGGIIELEGTIHISNLKICVDENKPVKLKVGRDNEGHRALVYLEGKKEVVYRSVKKS